MNLEISLSASKHPYSLGNRNIYFETLKLIRNKTINLKTYFFDLEMFVFLISKWRFQIKDYISRFKVMFPI